MSKAEGSGSSNLTLEEVQKVAKLSRLSLSAGEMQDIQSQLSAVLANFQTLSQIKTENIAPLFSPTAIVQSLRADEVESFPSNKLLENAPEKSGRLYKVPPVV